MYTIENRVGKLVELRIAAPIAAEELPLLLAEHQGITEKLGRFVTAVDLRRATLVPLEVAERFTGLMRGSNPRLERSAFLLNESALFSLQLERLIREAGDSNRRTFRAPEELVTWLGQVLSEAEQARLGEFLAEA